MPAVSTPAVPEPDLRVLLVEDDPATRTRLAQALGSLPGLRVVAACGDRQSALSWLAANEPDVLLSDLGLPDGSGIDVIRAASERYPRCDCMVITMFGDEANVLASIAAGATGYLLKDETDDNVRAAVLALRAGGSPMSPVIARKVITRLRGVEPEAPPAGPAAPTAPGPGAAAVSLSARETEVLDLISRGYTYAETASHLSISVHTVQAHIKNIYGKLAVNSRTEAVFEAHKLGLLKTL